MPINVLQRTYICVYGTLQQAVPGVPLNGGGNLIPRWQCQSGQTGFNLQELYFAGSVYKMMPNANCTTQSAQ